MKYKSLLELWKVRKNSRSVAEYNRAKNLFALWVNNTTQDYDYEAFIVELAEWIKI
jgi:hypothetical protein